MNDKVSLIAGSLLVISAMTVSGVVINSSAAGVEQSAAVVNSIQRPLPVSGVMQARIASSTEGQGLGADMVAVPRDLLRKMCSTLPVVQEAIKAMPPKGDAVRATTTSTVPAGAASVQ